MQNVNIEMNTDPDALMKGVVYATSPDPTDDEATRMARKIAALLIVTRLEQGGAPQWAIEEAQQCFREIYPGMFPKSQH